MLGPNRGTAKKQLSAKAAETVTVDDPPAKELMSYFRRMGHFLGELPFQLYQIALKTRSLSPIDCFLIFKNIIIYFIRK